MYPPNFIWLVLFWIEISEKFFKNEIGQNYAHSLSLLLLAHGSLVTTHSSLHLSLDLLHLYSFYLNYLLHFFGVAAKKVLLTLAVALSHFGVLLNEVAGADFNEYVVRIFHDPGNIKWRCQWHHDFLVFSVLAEVNENLFGLLELSETHLQLLVGLRQCLELCLECFSKLLKLLRSALGNIYSFAWLLLVHQVF